MEWTHAPTTKSRPCLSGASGDVVVVRSIALIRHGQSAGVVARSTDISTPQIAAETVQKIACIGERQAGWARGDKVTGGCRGGGADEFVRAAVLAPRKGIAETVSRRR